MMRTAFSTSIVVVCMSLATAVGCGDGGGGGQKAALRIRDTVIAPGAPTSVVTAPGGTTAYVSTQSALLMLDLVEARFRRLFPYTAPVSFVDARDATTSHVAVRGFSQAGSMSLNDGAFALLVQSGSLRRTSIANGFLYAPDFNERVLKVAALDGSSEFSINPYPDGTRTAGPSNSARSPSGRTVVFGDEFTQSVHAVDTETNTLRGTFIAGGSPLDVLALSDDLAIALFDGTIAYVQLHDPLRVPDLFRVALLDNALAYALDHEHERLFVARFDGGPYTEEPLSFEVGVLDLTTQEEIGGRLKLDIATNTFPGAALGVTDDGATVILTLSDATVYLLEPTSVLQ